MYGIAILLVSHVLEYALTKIDQIALYYIRVMHILLNDMCSNCLFQNIMAFMKCSINGKSYGDPHDSLGRKVDLDMVSHFMLLKSHYFLTRYDNSSCWLSD